jgi:hypothetical protein
VEKHELSKVEFEIIDKALKALQQSNLDPVTADKVTDLRNMFRDATPAGSKLIKRPLNRFGSKEIAMPARRFERIALKLMLSGCAVMFGACVLIRHAQAQPGYVPPPTPLPPPVLNPSNPGTVPQPPYTPITSSTPGATPSTVPSGEVRSPVSEEAPNTTPRPERQTSAAETRRVRHHHRGRFAGITWPYYCGSSPCVRIVVAEPPPVYRASVLWWPGFYDYADGQFTRGRPRYGGYPRPSGYHGD